MAQPTSGRRLAPIRLAAVAGFILIAIWPGEAAMMSVWIAQPGNTAALVAAALATALVLPSVVVVWYLTGGRHFVRVLAVTGAWVLVGFADVVARGYPWLLLIWLAVATSVIGFRRSFGD